MLGLAQAYPQNGSASAANPAPLVMVRAPQQIQTSGFDLKLLIALVRRRRRLALVVFLVILGYGAINTVSQRLFGPIYAGSFQLLVTDPINQETQGGDASSPLQDLALRNAGNVNTEILMQVLRSQLLLQPLAQSLRVSEGAISSGLSLSNAVRNTQGVLQVSLRWS